MKGSEVRAMIIGEGIRLWKVADALGITDNYLSRKLRYNFTDKEVERIKAAIEEIKQAETEEE